MIIIKENVFLKRAIGILGIVLSIGFCALPWGRGIDFFLYDSLFHLRGKIRPPDQIVVVAIDEPSLAIVGKRWPWPRGMHADLIGKLFGGGAAGVVFDLVFSELSSPQENGKLARSIREHSKTALATALNHRADEGFVRDTVVRPHPEIAGHNGPIGFINIPLDSDGFIRTARLTMGNLRSLSLQAAELVSPGTFGAGKDTGLINYYGPPGSLKTVSYYQAMEWETHLSEEIFRDRLVFVGFMTRTAAEIYGKVTDHYPVPFTRSAGQSMAGVEIHATIAGNIIQDSFIRPMPGKLVIPTSVILSLIFMFLFYSIRPGVGAGLLLVLLFGLFTLSYLLFVHYNCYMPVQFFCVPILCCYLVTPFVQYFKLWREKVFIRKAFASYVAPTVVKEILKSPETLVLGGEEREITAFFSDVAGFTAIAEKLSPVQLVGLLNEFLTEMTRIILDHGGTLDKFEGDAIIAFWGAPVSMENHAEAACRASVLMQLRLAELRRKWREGGNPELRMRIGICSGKAVVGNMGSKDRMDYTMMGDTVNTAARLEGANKVYGTSSLISDSALRSLGELFFTREIDTVILMGKKAPVTVHELLGLKEEVGDTVKRGVGLYEKGLHAYRSRKWDSAIVLFRAAMENIQDDGPSDVMMERCLFMRKEPPPDDWNGIFIMTSK